MIIIKTTHNFTKNKNNIEITACDITEGYKTFTHSKEALKKSSSRKNALKNTIILNDGGIIKESTLSLSKLFQMKIEISF